MVEGNGVSCFLQFTACGPHCFFSRNFLLEFDHDLSGWKQRKIAHEQHGVRAVDERRFAIAQHTQPDQIQGIDGGAGSAVGISLEAAFVGVIAKQQFIADDALVGGKNGLPRNARTGFLRGWLRLCAHGFSHLSSAVPGANFSPRVPRQDSFVRFRLTIASGSRL
jgi:hypothetical protein